MGTTPEFTVYLSSTVDDLKAERDAAVDVMRRHALVMDSYRPAEDGVVATCTADVRKCQLYVGIIGHRYGFVPEPGGEEDPDAKSISELEYEACRSEAPYIDRLIFIRTNSDDAFRDSENRPATMDRIKKFRNRANDEQQPYKFKDLADFREALTNAVRDAKEKFIQTNSGRPIMAGQQEWKHRLAPVAVGMLAGTSVPGSIQLPVSTLLARDRENRLASFDFSLDSPHQPFLASLDQIIAKGQLPCLLLTSAALSRCQTPQGIEQIAIGIEVLKTRVGVAVILCLGLDPAVLPEAWQAATPIALRATANESVEQTAVTLETLFTLHLRKHAPDLTTQSRLALPYLVLAPTGDEAGELLKANSPLFDRFPSKGEEALRRAELKILADALREAHPCWPDKTYEEARADWHCFGENGDTAQNIVEEAIRRVNTALPGSREHRLLRGARLLPRRYRLEEFLTDRYGSRQAIQQACDSGCLILVDELALLHPDLRDASRQLLASRRSAFISLSAADPAHSPMRDLLGDLSYQRIASLVERYSTELDPMCNIAVNSLARGKRWLSLAIPELALGKEDLAPEQNTLRKVEDDLRG